MGEGRPRADAGHRLRALPGQLPAGKARSVASWGYATIGLAIICALVVAALPNRFIADDYVVASELRLRGFFGALAQEVRATNGRFAGFLITNLLVSLGPHGAPFATVLALVALLGGCASIVARLEYRQAARALGVATMLAAALATSTPIIDQTYLWVSGIGMAATSTIALVWLGVAIAWCIPASGLRRRLLLATCVALGIFCSGSYETTGLTAIIVGALLAIAAIRRLPRGARMPLLAAFAGLGIGLLLVAAMPGTAIRRDAFPPTQGLVASLAHGWRPALDFLLDQLIHPATGLALVAGLAVTRKPAPTAFVVRVVVLLVIAVVASTWMTFSLSLYAISGTPVPRTLAIPAFVLTAAAFFAGWVMPRPRHALVDIALAACSILLAVMLVSPIVADLPMRREWSKDWQARDRQLRASRGEAIATVPSLEYAANGLEDIKLDPTHWVNQRMAMYHGVGAVVATPDSPAGRAARHTSTTLDGSDRTTRGTP